jgi:hypothetical protein
MDLHFTVCIPEIFQPGPVRNVQDNVAFDASDNAPENGHFIYTMVLRNPPGKGIN